MIEHIMKRITIVLFNQGGEFNLPNDYPFTDNRCIRIKDCTIPINPKEAYGNLGGLYRLWKEISADWICFNNGSVIPTLTDEHLRKLEKKENRIIVSHMYNSSHLQENYRSLYYGYDFSMMLALLKRLAPDYYKWGKKEVFESQEFCLLSAVMPKKEYDSFCAWMFSILEKCAKYIPLKYSTFQNSFLEYMAPYLFTLYVSFNKKKLKPLYVFPQNLINSEQDEKETKLREQDTEAIAQMPDSSTASREEILEQISHWMDKREVEKAVWYASLIPQKRTELSDVKTLFEQYERERRYYRKTILNDLLDENYCMKKDWKSLLKQPKKQIVSSIRHETPKLLFFRWASVGRDLNEEAFRQFGFECHTFEAPHRMFSFDEDCLEQINRHLDKNKFDLVFSMNCFGMLAEACYIHGIPYIAWCYDAPTFSGDKWYLHYPTTHVFLFDSDDAWNYQSAGIKNAHYCKFRLI